MAGGIGRLDPAMAARAAGDNMDWYDASLLTLEGKGWQDTERFYDRLPARAKAKVTPEVWDLSRCPAGMAIRFETDATDIAADFKARNPNDLSMPHMTAVGTSGLDLYFLSERGWRWIGSTKFWSLQDLRKVELVGGLAKAGMRQFMLYLPMYNGIDELKLGLTSGATLRPLPEREKPVVFYGTSITQGGCACRPGMAYTSIVCRRLDVPHINLGFSGNGKTHLELAELMCELDASLYLFDTMGNSEASDITDRLEASVKMLRKARPNVPIALLERMSFPMDPYIPHWQKEWDSKITAWRSAAESIRKAGVKNVHFLSNENLIGDDGEGTVDGIHPTDLGFFRMAEILTPEIGRILTSK